MTTKTLADTAQTVDSGAKELSSIVSSDTVQGTLSRFATQLSDATAYITHQVMDKAPKAFDLLCEAMRLSAAVQVFQGLIGVLIMYLAYKAARRFYTISTMDNGWCMAVIGSAIVGALAAFHTICILFNSDIFITLISPQAELALLALRKAGIGLF